MDNTLWIHSNLELSELIDKKQHEALSDYVNSNQELIFANWAEGQLANLSMTLKYGASILKYFKTSLGSIRDSMLVDLGSLLGTIDSFSHLLYEQGQEQWTSSHINEVVATTKHLSEVVSALEVHGAMTHTELCTYLNMSNPSTLTEAMKKIIQTGVVQSRIAGKYKVYTLTDKGIRYGRSIRKKKKTANQLEDILRAIERINEDSDTEQRKALADRLISIIFPDARVLYKHDDVSIVDKYTHKTYVHGEVAGLLNEIDRTGSRELNIVLDTSSSQSPSAFTNTCNSRTLHQYMSSTANYSRLPKVKEGILSA